MFPPTAVIILITAQTVPSLTNESLFRLASRSFWHDLSTFHNILASDKAGCSSIILYIFPSPALEPAIPPRCSSFIWCTEVLIDHSLGIGILITTGLVIVTTRFQFEELENICVCLFCFRINHNSQLKFKTTGLLAAFLTLYLFSPMLNIHQSSMTKI